MTKNENKNIYFQAGVQKCRHGSPEKRKKVPCNALSSISET